MTCLGDAVLAEATKDLGKSTDFGLPGVFCSLAVRTWLRAAAQDTGETAPIEGSAGAKATKAQFEAKGLWVPVESIRANPSIIVPGMIVVWHRGEPGACTGHIGVVDTVYDPKSGTFGTIEANAAPTISRFRRRLDGANLLGMGYFPCATTSARAAASSSVAPVVIVLGVLGAAGLALWYALPRTLDRLPRAT
jgi:hypothetical protein